MEVDEGMLFMAVKNLIEMAIIFSTIDQVV